MKHNFQNIKKIFSISLVMVLAFGVMAFAFPAETVHAANSNETVPPPADPAAPDGQGLRNKLLERAFQRENKNHDRQEKLFNVADRTQNRIETFIAKVKGEGKDTTGLEAALVKLTGEVAKARVSYDQAGTNLKNHSGFDADGKVVDVEAAKVTLKDVNKFAKECRETMTTALKDLHKALKEFREANPKTPEPDVTAPAS
jgi:hypothetical protein